ncbi:hypothetical protein ACGTN9_18885 [Halobacillus sp. MO56]
MGSSIVFVSSNYRDLYVEDIYRALGLPKGFVIQYRYRIKNIDENILAKLKYMRDKEGVIFYCYDPSDKAQYHGDIKQCDEKVFIPIRKVKFIDYSRSEETEQINFFLELHEFIDIETDVQGSLNNLMAMENNVGEIEIKTIKKVSWLKKVESIENYFKEVNFFYVNDIAGKLSMKYEPTEKKANLILYDESIYTLNVLTYDKSEGQGFIDIVTEGEYLNLNDTLEKGTKLNSKTLTVDTRPIDFRKDRTYLELKDTNSKFGVKMSVTIKKRFKRSFWFGGLSSLALFGFQFSNLIIKNNLTWENTGWLLSAAILVALGVSGLHWRYNQK